MSFRKLLLVYAHIVYAHSRKLLIIYVRWSSKDLRGPPRLLKYNREHFLLALEQVYRQRKSIMMTIPTAPIA